MKVNKLIGVMVVLALATTVIAFAVTNQEEASTDVVKMKVVRTQVAEYVTEPAYLEYMGMIEADKQVNLSFSQGGILEQVYVQKGDVVEKGQTLAELDSEFVQFAERASSAQINAAKATHLKAKEALEYSRQQYDKMQKLFDGGVISKDQFDLVKLDYEVKQSDYNASLESINQAQANNGVNRKSLNEMVLKSEIDGYVVDVVYEVGESVGAGYPTVIIRSIDNTLKVGIAQKDITMINLDTMVRIEHNGKLFDGRVLDIGQVPDPQTRTYVVEVGLTETNIPLGTVAKAYFEIGEREGIKVPVTSIMNFESDYVYTVETGKVVQKPISITTLQGVYAYVEGLNEGDLIITEGQKRVQNADDVMIAE